MIRTHYTSQTDRRTDGRTTCHSIAAICRASCGKNDVVRYTELEKITNSARRSYILKVQIHHISQVKK